MQEHIADVSIVVPAYNAARFIGEAIASVRAQTHVGWELIVVDDGSTDDTVSLVRGVDDERVRLVQILHSGLPAVARNRGLTETQAPIVAFLDADDVWRPEKLERQLAVLGARPDVGLVHCAAQVLGDPTAPVAKPSREGEPLFLELLDRNFIYNSSVVLRRSVLDEHGVLDTDPDLRGSEDYELWLRLAVDIEFAYVAEPLLLYRRHPAGLNASDLRASAARVGALRRAREKNPALFDQNATFLRALAISRYRADAPGSGPRELLARVREAPQDRLAWTWFLRSLLGFRTIRRLRPIRTSLRLSWLARRLRGRDPGTS